MRKTLSLAIGSLVVFVGLVLLIIWWYEFLFLLKGTIPVLLILGGVIALFAGFAELKDTLKDKK